MFTASSIATLATMRSISEVPLLSTAICAITLLVSTFGSPTTLTTRNATLGGCGVPVTSQRRPLIVLGEVARAAGEWPWHASIWHRVAHGTYVYVCGGTLLSELYVLTAGHCVSKDGNALNERLITVQLGSVRQNLLIGGFPVQNVAVASNILHEDFAPRSFQADVAMLALKTKVAFNDFVRPACLPAIGDGSDGKDLNGRQAVAIGFGMTEQAETADVLRKIRLPIVDYVTCLESNRKVFGTALSTRVLCAGNRNGSTICNGDSGGGLFTEEEGGKWVLRGVISFTAQRGWNDTSCSLTDYSAFVNVAYYGDWIRYVLEHGDQQGFFNRTGAVNVEKKIELKAMKSLRISEKKCKEYRRKGLTSVRPATLNHYEYFKNATHTISDIYTKHESVRLNVNISDVGLVYYVSDCYALTTVEVALNCTLENTICKTIHKAIVHDVFVHPKYHSRSRDFNVAVVRTDPADEFFWCLSTEPSNNLRIEGSRLPLSLIVNETYSWVEFDVDWYIRSNPAQAVYTERQDEIAGLLQNSAGEPVVMSNVTAVLNWIESVVWNATYVMENVSEASVRVIQPSRQLRASTVACKKNRRAGLTSVNPAEATYTEFFKNSTYQKTTIYTKYNAVEIFKNEETIGIAYYVSHEYAISTANIAINCSQPLDICVTNNNKKVLQICIHPNFTGGRDYNVALLRTAPAVEYLLCLAVEPAIQLYYGPRHLPMAKITKEQPTWAEFDSEVYLRISRGAALYTDRQDELVGLMQGDPAEELVMTNVTALLDWIEPIVWRAEGSHGKRPTKGRKFPSRKTAINQQSRVHLKRNADSC